MIDHQSLKKERAYQTNSQFDMGEFIQLLPIGCLVFNSEYGIVETNTKADQMFGASHSLIGKTLPEICEFKQETQQLLQLIDSNTNNSLNITFKQFAHGHMHSNVHVARYGGQTLLFVENITDIVALTEELRNFKFIIELSDAGIALFDCDGMIFYVNPAYEYFSHYPLEEAIGTPIQQFWEKHFSAEIASEMWESIQKGCSWKRELSCHPAHMPNYEVDIHIKPIKNEYEENVGYILIQRDITQQKRLEKELSTYSEILENKVEERTNALSKLHEISHLFHTTESLDKRLRLVLIAATAGETFRFNRAFLLLVDENYEWLEGKIAIGPSTPEEANHIWNSIDHLPKDGTITGSLQTYLENAGDGDPHVNDIVRRLSTPLSNSKSIFVQCLQKRRCMIVRRGKTDSEYDQTIIEILESDNFAVIPLLVEDKPVGVLVVDNIITQKIIIDEDLKLLSILASQAALAIANANLIDELAQKIKEIEQAYSELSQSHKKLIDSEKFAALGQMAATVAHEIRTPLVAIGGFANTMLKTTSEDHKNYQYLKIIRDEALRLEDVLSHLLYYARPSTPLKETQDINTFIDSILQFMEPEFNHNDITIEKTFAENMPMISFDRNQMRQVLINILKNSIQSMNKGGTICIETFFEDQFCALNIADKGEGIGSKHLDRIFEPFYSTKHAGTGLGLHISRRIVTSHGGSLTISSQLGEGTNVVIRLPL